MFCIATIDKIPVDHQILSYQRQEWSNFKCGWAEVVKFQGRLRYSASTRKNIAYISLNLDILDEMRLSRL